MLKTANNPEPSASHVDENAVSVYTLKTYIILLINVTPINIRKVFFNDKDLKHLHVLNEHAILSIV